MILTFFDVSFCFKALEFSIWICSSSIHDFCPFALHHNWQVVLIDKAFAFLRILSFHEILFKWCFLGLVYAIRLSFIQSFDTAFEELFKLWFVGLIHIVLNDVFTNPMISHEEYYRLSKKLFFLYDIVFFFFKLFHLLEDFDAFKGTYSYNMLLEAHKSTANSQHHLISSDQQTSTQCANHISTTLRSGIFIDFDHR